MALPEYEASPPDVQLNEPLESALTRVVDFLRNRATRGRSESIFASAPEPPVRAAPSDADPETSAELSRLLENFRGYLNELRQEVQDELSAADPYREVADEIEYGKQWIVRGLAAFEADREAVDVRIRRAAVRRPARGELGERIASAHSACAEIDAAIDAARGGARTAARLREAIARAREEFRYLGGLIEGETMSGDVNF